MNRIFLWSNCKIELINLNDARRQRSSKRKIKTNRGKYHGYSNCKISFWDYLFLPEQKNEQTKKIKRLENFWSKHQTPRERSSESRSF